MATKLTFQEEVENHCHIAMDQVDMLRALFAGIAMLIPTESNRVVYDLATHGKNIAEGLHNDIDVLREQAEDK
jgi:hypothetical protein